MTLEIGSRFAGYQIESLLARGGMGEVYLARNTVLNRLAALKVLRPEYAQDETFRERFLREANQAASLKHPNIVTIYDAGEVDGSLFLAMEYVSGGDLRDLLRREGRIAPSRAIGIIGQIGSALDAAHARGLVHRDIKPGNILVDPLEPGQPAERAYLADFGLSKLDSTTRALTQTGSFLGTVAYVAPEVVEGRPADARSDAYALGCALYESLTGVVPFPRETEVAIINAHLRDAVPPPTTVRPDLPPALDAVIGRALAKKPEYRFASCGELAASAATALGVTPPPQSPLPPIAMPATPPPPPPPTLPPPPPPMATPPTPLPIPVPVSDSTPPTMPMAAVPPGPPTQAWQGMPAPAGPPLGPPGMGVPPGYSSGPPGPPRSGSKSGVIALVVFLLVAGGGTGAFLLLRKSGNPSPGPSPTPTSTTTFSPTPTFTFSPSPTDSFSPSPTETFTITPSSSGFTFAERDLLSHVPTDWRSTCEPNSSYAGGTGLAAHLTCHPRSNISVFYDVYDTVAHMNSEFAALTSTVPVGNCSTNPAGPAKGTYTRAQVTVGSLMCRTSGSGFREMLWTFDGERILANAFSRDATNKQVYDFWSSDGGPLSSSSSSATRSP